MQLDSHINPVSTLVNDYFVITIRFNGLLLLGKIDESSPSL